MPSARVAVIGAGMAGLTAAIDLARSGCEVVLFERAAAPGGKLREVAIADARLDAGPTVFTLRGVFDQLFADAGDDLDRRLKLVPAQLWRGTRGAPMRGSICTPTWNGPSMPSARLPGSPTRAPSCVSRPTRSASIATLDRSFMRASRPSPVGLVRRVGLGGLADLWNIKPFVTLWQAVSRYFTDPRLRQLFGRYATYCGSSPFERTGDADARGACRAGGRVVRRGRHAPPGRATGGARGVAAASRCAARPRSARSICTAAG